jgi:hypothetical protein
MPRPFSAKSCETAVETQLLPQTRALPLPCSKTAERSPAVTCHVFSMSFKQATYLAN